MVRTGRPRNSPGRLWSEIGVSACVLLVPPILIGAGVYAMLPVHEDGAARNSPRAAVESQPADFESRSAFDAMRGADEPQEAVAALVSPMNAAIIAAKPAMSATTKPAAAAAAAAKSMPAAATKPAAAAKADTPQAKPAAAPKVATPEPTTFALASDRSELVGKDVTRALGPVPVQVVVVAPNAEGDGGEPASLDAAAPSPFAAPPSAPAASPPAIEAPQSTEAPREHRRGAWHTVRSRLPHLARHSEARAEAHSAHPAVEPQHEFSLRGLFPQQQGGRQKSAVRG